MTNNFSNVVICSDENNVDTLGNVGICRHAYNDYLIENVPFEQASGFKWDYCGADNAWHNSPRIYCYIPYELACDKGLIRHKMRENSMYDVKVCVIAKYTNKKAMKEIKEMIGAKPKKIKL